MPQPTRKKDSDYLRFRPYHAFTTPAPNSAQETWRTAIWRAVLVVGGVALLAAAALWFFLH